MNDGARMNDPVAVTPMVGSAVQQLCTAIDTGDLLLSPPLLTLADGRQCQCLQLLRLLPGKRAVLSATVDGRPVLAKFFRTAASRQMQRELEGHRRLKAALQPVPELQAQYLLDGGTLLLYEFLPDAKPLLDEATMPNAAAIDCLLERLQSMYMAGVYQSDLHWGNFLWARDRLYVLDPAEVQGAPGQPLAAAQIIDNLGLLVAQFRRCDQPAVHAMVMNSSIKALAGVDSSAVSAATERHWQRRKTNLLAKCFRNTTALQFQQSFDCVWAVRRSEDGADLQAFLADPNAFMGAGEMLKRGNSATVVKVDMDGRSVVIKRYNVKNVGHWLRRCWRPSRAWASWRNAHWLELLGLPTPAPIAFYEKRCGPLRCQAYYVCEFNDGVELDKLLQERAPNAGELRQIANYFTLAASDHLIHGDMKATNLFMCSGVLNVLDLDAMREVPEHRRWVRLFRRDIARFSRNWPVGAPAAVSVAALLDPILKRLNHLLGERE